MKSNEDIHELKGNSKWPNMSIILISEGEGNTERHLKKIWSKNSNFMKDKISEIQEVQ